MRPAQLAIKLHTIMKHWAWTLQENWK